TNTQLEFDFTSLRLIGTRPGYPKESPFDLIAYSDSDYGGATQDCKSTTGGCQFLGRRDCFEKKLISVDHIHTDVNVADLLTKPFDAWRFQHLVEKSKLQDEEGISSLPDTEFFENLTLMDITFLQIRSSLFKRDSFLISGSILFTPSCNVSVPKVQGLMSSVAILPLLSFALLPTGLTIFSKMIFDGLVKNVNNKVSKFLMYPRFLTMFLTMTQFGQITHTQKYVVPFHTKKLFTTLRVNSPSFSGRVVPLFDTMLVQQGEGSGTPTEPHHTPSPEALSPSYTTHTLPTLPPVTTTSIPTVTPTETTHIRQYTRRARIAQSSALPTVADEPASHVRDVSQGEAYPIDSGFIAEQDRATIDKSST
nr:putative ribonuclease H-like domain-containing protein [Tanacetum cinerariifolium]